MPSKVLLDNQSAMMQEVFALANAIADLPSDARWPNVQPRLLVVGGFVRDMVRVREGVILGEEVKDVDVEVYGVSPGALASMLLHMYPGRVRDVGASFGILMVVFDGFTIDVAVPRRERKIGARHSDFVVDADPGLTVVEALRRRDFTVNAMAWDPLRDEIIDPYGGQEALKSGVLDVVDPKTFVEDPLRVYRGVQFVARFGFLLSDRARALMVDMVSRGELRHLAPERVTDEWRKMLLKSMKPSVGLVLLRELGVLAAHFPELEVMATTAQEPEWHPEGDVFTHTCMVIDCAAEIIRRDALDSVEREQVMVGALCHDLGKPGTTAVDAATGRVRSLGHEEEGVVVAKTFLKKFVFGSVVVDAVLGVAADHLKPGMLFRSLEKGELNEKQYAGAVRKLLRRVAPASWRVLVAVAEADFRGRGFTEVPDVYHAGEKLRSVVLTAGLEETLKTTLVRGEDIIVLTKKLGLPEVKPGPQFGALIREVEEMRDRGELVTREDGLVKLEELLRVRK